MDWKARQGADTSMSSCTSGDSPRVELMEDGEERSLLVVVKDETLEDEEEEEEEEEEEDAA